MEEAFLSLDPFSWSSQSLCLYATRLLRSEDGRETVCVVVIQQNRYVKAIGDEIIHVTPTDDLLFKQGFSTEDSHLNVSLSLFSQTVLLSPNLSIIYIRIFD